MRITVVAVCLDGTVTAWATPHAGTAWDDLRDNHTALKAGATIEQITEALNGQPGLIWSLTEQNL